MNFGSQLKTQKCSSSQDFWKAPFLRANYVETISSFQFCAGMARIRRIQIKYFEQIPLGLWQALCYLVGIILVRSILNRFHWVSGRLMLFGENAENPSNSTRASAVQCGEEGTNNKGNQVLKENHKNDGFSWKLYSWAVWIHSIWSFRIWRLTTGSFTFGIGFSFERKFKTRLDSYRNW